MLSSYLVGVSIHTSFTRGRDSQLQVSQNYLDLSHCRLISRPNLKFVNRRKIPPSQYYVRSANSKDEK